MSQSGQVDGLTQDLNQGKTFSAKIVPQSSEVVVVPYQNSMATQAFINKVIRNFGPQKVMVVINLRDQTKSGKQEPACSLEIQGDNKFPSPVAKHASELAHIVGDETPPTPIED